MRALYTLVSLLLTVNAFCATITGDVTDLESKSFIAEVKIENIRTGLNIYTAQDGKFSVTAEGDDLLEFSKMGYKTVRVRIPKGNIPPYFKIIMQKSPIELPEHQLSGNNKDFVKDSLKYYNIYKQALEFEKITGLDVIRHPFSALSKRNRRIWAFQEEFNYFQKEKFIDYTFNETIITTITGLQGDSLQFYMRRFRPTYDQLHNMTEYSFYTYIRQSAIFYRSGRRPDYKPNIIRNSN